MGSVMPSSWVVEDAEGVGSLIASSWVVENVLRAQGFTWFRLGCSRWEDGLLFQRKGHKSALI